MSHANDPTRDTNRGTSGRAEGRLNGDFPTCVRCGSELPAPQGRVIADTCPTCGFRPESHRTKMLLWATLSVVLTASVVGIPFAAFTFWKAFKHRAVIRGGLTGEK